MGDSVRLVAVTRAIGGDRIDREMPHGLTIAEMLAEAGVVDRPGATTRVLVGDEAISREHWERVRPKAGTIVSVRVVPQATVVAIVAAIGAYLAAAGVAISSAVVVSGVTASLATIGVTSAIAIGITSGLVTIAIGVGVSIGVSLAARAIVGTPKQKGQGDSGGRSDSPTLAGSRNSVLIGRPVWRVMGQHKVYPPLAASAYTTIVGNKQYMRLLYSIGYGPVEVSDVRIGDAPITNYPGAQVEIRQGFSTDTPITGYPGAVVQEFLALPFRTPNTADPYTSQWSQRTTADDTDEIHIDFSAPGGIIRLNEDGKKKTHHFGLEIEYADYNAPTVWMAATDNPTFGPYGGYGNAEHFGRNVAFSGKHQYPFLTGFAWRVPKGRYHVRIRRNEFEGPQSLPGGKDTSAVIADIVWIALKSVRYEAPIALAGQALLSLYMEATEANQGQVDALSCIVEGMTPTWSAPGGWTAPVVTRNPAWWLLEALRGTANPRPIEDAKLDLAAFASWAANADAAGRTFDHVVDYETTVGELSYDIAAAGRASFDNVDGRYTVTQDRPQSLPVQVFSPRNSWGFAGTHILGPGTHAAKVKFVDAADGWKSDGEVIVYDDGYSLDGANGTQPATRIDSIELVGITSRDLAWKDGRYYLASSRLRPAVYRLEADVENLVCRRGDLVRVTHDVPLWGLAAGRIKSLVTGGGGEITSVTLDETVSMASGNYSARIRTILSGALRSVVATVVTVPGDTNTLAFSPAIPAVDAPQVGDLLLFGETGRESVELLVKAVRMRPDLTAEIELVDYSPAVYDADTSPIPAYDPQITMPIPAQFVTPAEPLIAVVISDEAAMTRAADGRLIPGIVALLQQSPAARGIVIALAAQYRATGQTDWIQIDSLPAGADRVQIVGLEVGTSYDLRVRAIGRNGTASGWAIVTGHVVEGASTRPPDIQDLRLEQGLTLRWFYPVAPIDLAGFIVRTHVGQVVTWENAQSAHDGVISATQLYVGDFATGLRTFLVKAIDVAGNESETAAALTRDLGDALVANIVLTQDEVAAGFLGEKTNCTVTLGNLGADEDPTFFWNPDDNRFWATGANPFWTSSYLDMVYQFSVSPGASNAGGSMTLLLATDGAATTIEYAVDTLFWGAGVATFWGAGADPFWDVTQLDFSPFPGRIDAYDKSHVFRISIAGGPEIGLITVLQARIDVPDIIERFEDVAIAAIGTRLALTQTYRDIRLVNLTAQKDAGTGVSARIVDKNFTLGPKIEVLDAAGTAVAGTIDAVVQGY